MAEQEKQEEDKNKHTYKTARVSSRSKIWLARIQIYRIGP